MTVLKAYMRTALDMVGIGAATWFMHWLNGEQMTGQDFFNCVGIYALVRSNMEKSRWA